MSDRDRIIKPLGDGGQGYVQLVDHNGQLLARKEINIGKKGIEQCRKEAEMLQLLLGRAVVIYKDCYYSIKEKKFYIYTEYFKNGDLHHLIKNRNHRDFEIPIVIKYMKDLIRAVKYIHSNGVVHRDLKPRNILISDNNELIIGDFGLAIEIDKLDNHFVGTYSYIAPEIYLHEHNPPYSFASDIFALGCIFYEIYTLKQLFDEKSGKEEIKNKIFFSNESFESNSERNSLIEELIKKMVDKNPDTRIKMKEIEDYLGISSIPNTVVNSNVSVSNTSTTSSSIPQIDNITTKFYLNNGYIQGISLDMFIEMSQEEFNKAWKYEFIFMLFPIVRQENPPFPEEAAKELINRKSEYEDKLLKLLHLIDNLDENMKICILESINIFLDSIELQYSFNGIDSINNSFNTTSITSSIQPPPPSITPSTSRTIPIYQRGDLHPSRWIFLTNIDIPNCPSQVRSLYYERPDEGNRLLSVNGEPPFTHYSATIKGSEGLDNSFIDKIRYGDWWYNTKEEEYVYVPVFQRGGHHPSKWIFIANAPIKAEYKDLIHKLYYARSNEGNELLSVVGEPDFYHLKGRQVEGAFGIPKEYLNEISQCGWWK